MADTNYMRFITGIHFTKGALRALNGITFLFDSNWSPEKNETATLPVVFFHIKSIHEVNEADVSQKQMLFYNSQNSTDVSTTVGSVLNIVSDNIVVKPKQYKLDLIVPFDDLSLLQSSTVLNVHQFTGVVNALTGLDKKDFGKGMNAISSYLTMATPYINIATQLFKQLSSANYSSAQDFITSVMSTPDYNKNSLEAMFYNRQILKLKLWNGWKYKYVVITSMDISKEGTDDNVYEVSLTLQEVPILTIRNESGSASSTYTSLSDWMSPKLDKAKAKVSDIASAGWKSVMNYLNKSEEK